MDSYDLTGLTERAVAAYWGLAIGDALGATVEFMTPREIRHQHGSHDSIRGGGWLGLKPGQVTDDTAMALALGEAILSTSEVEPNSIARQFDQWLRSKPVDVGQTVRRGIVHYRRTGEPVVPESEDAGNGACMRLLPVALFTLGQSVESIRSASQTQAHVTHNNPQSDIACETVIHLVHGALLGADKSTLLGGPIAGLRQEHPEFNFRQRRIEHPGGYIVETMQAVLQAFIDTDSFQECLVDVVNRGGDADTTGAIAGMIAGAYYGMAGIPQHWLSALDAEVRSRCRRQAKRLMQLSLTDTGDSSAQPLAQAVM